MIAAFLTFSVAISLAQPARPVHQPHVFTPAEDAHHTVGQPGHLKPPTLVPQPQPKPTRLLPQTAETMRGPGLWAGHEPKTSVEPVCVVAGVPIYPSGQDRIDEVSMSCGSEVDRAAREARLISQLGRLSEDAHLCAVASMMLQCAIMRKEVLKTRKPEDEFALARHDAAVRYFRYVVGLECRDEIALALRGLLSTWSAALTPFVTRGHQ